MHFRPRWHPSLWFSVHAPVVAVAPMAQPEAEPTMSVTEAPPVRFSVGADTQVFSGGFSVGAQASVEGDVLGLFVEGAGVALAADDGSYRWDRLGLASAHLSVAVLASDSARLRLLGGVDSVFAPDLIVAGPSLGIGGVVWLVGPLALEGSTTATFWPHLQVDARANLALGFGPLAFRIGARALWLDDRGLVDGVAHGDLLVGPSAGFSLVF